MKSLCLICVLALSSSVSFAFECVPQNVADETHKVEAVGFYRYAKVEMPDTKISGISANTEMERMASVGATYTIENDIFGRMNYEVRKQVIASQTGSPELDGDLQFQSTSNLIRYCSRDGMYGEGSYTAQCMDFCELETRITVLD